jgi:hypothetical protein
MAIILIAILISGLLLCGYVWGVVSRQKRERKLAEELSRISQR